MAGDTLTFWQDRWQRGDTGWHKADVDALLRTHWPSLGFAANTRVLVPFCGASLDMRWLAERGHKIVGVEISELAITRFFAEQKLQPTVTTRQHGALHHANSYSIFQADIFSLTSNDIGPIAAIYDRAALIASPAADRRRYATQLTAWSRPGTVQLLLTLDYTQAQMAGPPYAVPDAEVQDLYSRDWNIACLADCDGLPQSTKLKERGLTALRERAYRLTRR